MSLKDIGSIWDGDQGPTVRLELKDSAGAAKDLSNVVVECRIVDEAGTLVASRPGVIVSPKSSGYVDVWLAGRETDWDGAGKVLYVKPRIWIAVTEAGAAATNVLTNPSFDTDGNADGVADNWTKTGSWTASMVSDDPMPAAIFGQAQGGIIAAGGTNHIAQTYATAIAAGDIWWSGVWYRGTVTAGTPSTLIEQGYVQAVPSGTSNWAFLRSYRVYTASDTAITFRAYNGGSSGTGTFRVDDAFLFKGQWIVSPCDPFRLNVQGRSRIAKTGGNLMSGIGDFEYDSDSDGLCDGWTKSGSSVVYTREVDPDLYYAGRSSQKCVLTDPTNNRIWAIKRGHFKSGETWSAKVRVLTSGTLSAGSGTGGFQITLRTEDYDGTAQTASTTLTNPAAAWTDHTASITLTEDRDALVVEIWLNGKTGTMYLDDVRLTRA